MNLPNFQLMTNIKVLNNVPINSSYNDQLTFNSIGEQTSYFLNKAKYTFSSCSPVRDMSSAYIQLPVCADYIYDCNYIMFQNANFNQKWFYGFITEIRFINVNSCIVQVILDIWQTWLFDMDIGQCMVEREHVNNDTVGANTYPEGLEHGEYVLEELEKIVFGTSITGDTVICFQTTFNNDESLSDATGSWKTNVYSGLTYISFTTAADANNFINKITSQNKQDGVINVFMMPAEFFVEDANPAEEFTTNLPKAQSTLGSYTPVNKKLLCWPFNYLYITNLNGKSNNYNYEDFAGNCTFTITGDTSANPTLALYPVGYKVPNGVENKNEMITLNGWPVCAWTNDATQAWIAQERGALIASGVTTLTGSVANIIGGTVNGAMGGASAGGGYGALGGGISSFVGGTISAGIDIFNKAVSLVGEYYDHESKPPVAHGTQGSSVLMAMDSMWYYYGQMHIKPEYAKKIDDFFTRFGYKVMELKTPNITGRPYWNYVKCVDANVQGNIPYEDTVKLQAILDNGCTFWHVNNGAVQVGNYSLDNSPT